MWCGRTARVQCMWFRRSQLQIHRLNWTRQFLQKFGLVTKPRLSPISCIFLLLLSESCPDLRLQPCSIWCCEAVLGIPKFNLDSKILKNTTGSHGQSIHFIHHPTLTWSPKKCHQKHGCVDFHNGNQIDLSCFGH